MNLMNSPVLSIKNLSKRFGTVQANDTISLDLYSNRIHALVGENGAGKSTLVSILYGLQQADEGEILLDGYPFTPESPTDSLNNRIGLVQQHFSLIPAFTVLENLMLGQERCSRFGIDRKKTEHHIQQTLLPYGIELPLHERVQSLPVGIQQRVEIAKVLLYDARILLFDEPTAALVPSEIEEFLATLNSLREQGLTVVFITHHLPEVLQVADDLTVLRQGRVVLQGPLDQFTQSDIATAIVGERLPEESFPSIQQGSTRLRFDSVYVPKLQPNDMELSDLNLEIKQGEIFGVAGVTGNGQNEWVQTLLGIRPVRSGEIVLEEQCITNFSPIQRRQLGMAYIPEDRWKEGMISDFSIQENFMLHPVGLGQIDRFWVNSKSIQETVGKCIEQFRIQAQTMKEPISSLSGGHQQRTVVARELLQSPKLIIAHNPSRGLDIRATRFVHEILYQEASHGAAILLFSSDLDELFQLAYRIGVLYKGRLVEVRQCDQWDGYQLGKAMIGGNA